MPELHRATPEQWTHVAICADLKQQVPWATADCLLELRDRVEALEAAQLEQAESNRFCTDAIVRRVEALEAAQQDKLDRLIAMDRIEALEATQHAHADVSHLNDADRERVAQELAKPARVFTAKEVAPIVAPATRARFISEVFQAASAEVRPTVKDSLTDGGGLVERVARSIERTVDFNPDSYAPEACAAIREVAVWLRKQGGYPNEWTAQMLEKEADRG